MNFRDFLLEEMFDEDSGYKATKVINGSDVIFDIETGESRNYRFSFKKSSDDFYIAELGYASEDRYGVVEIKGDFYDTNKLISTMVGIFTGFYISTNDIGAIVYKYQRDVNKSYKLLVYSIFKNELKNYYNVDTDGPIKDFGMQKYIVLKSNRSQQLNIDYSSIEKLLSKY